MNLHFPQSNKESGFTIIEVLIVLTIAGMIMLIIFNILPTLNRNSRANQQKQDIASILHAVSNWEVNNSGSFPSGCGDAAPQNPCDTAPTPSNQYTVVNPLYDVHLNYYDPSTPGNVVIKAGNPRQTLVYPNDYPTNTNQVYVYNYQNCLPKTAGTPGYATDRGAGYNDIVALYNIEQPYRRLFLECQKL